MKKEKLLVLTGAGQGIGGYLAKELSKEYSVCLISKSNNCKKIANEINKAHSNSADYVQLNFEGTMDFSSLDKKVDFEKFREINFIFCAGYVEDYSDDINITEWRKAFNINIFGHLEIFNFFLPKMKNSNKTNKVIFFSGGGAAGPFETFPAYSASKTALVRTIENLSLRYEKFKLSIFAIAPGAIETEMLNKVLEKTTVGTKTSKKEVFYFIKHYLKNDSNKLNGKLVHIRDNKKELEKNNDINYLKLRRIE